MLTVLFRTPQGGIVVTADQFELRSSNDGLSHKPVDIKTNLYTPDKSPPYYSRWVHLKFLPLSEQLDQITFVFPQGSVLVNGHAVELAPFRFRKVERQDVYYASINC